MTIPDSSGPRDRDDALDWEAAHWCTLMHGDDAQTLRTEFEQWLGRSPGHRDAYNRVKEVYLLGARSHEGDQFERTDPRPATSSRVGWLGLAAIAAAVLLTLGLVKMKSADRPGSAAQGVEGVVALRTSQSGEDSFALKDGSKVRLASASAVQVAFGTQFRRLTLTHGAALFTVAQDVRPFVVEVGGGTVTAIGTEFQVALGEDRNVRIHVTRGDVAVELPTLINRQQGRATRLHAGQRLRFASSWTPVVSVERAVRGHPSPQSDKQPRTVGEMIAAANSLKGDHVVISVDDTALLSVQLGGTFTVRSPEEVARRLAILFDLKTDLTHQGKIVLHP